MHIHLKLMVIKKSTSVCRLPYRPFPAWICNENYVHSKWWHLQAIHEHNVQQSRGPGVVRPQGTLLTRAVVSCGCSLGNADGVWWCGCGMGVWLPVGVAWDVVMCGCDMHGCMVTCGCDMRVWFSCGHGP